MSDARKKSDGRDLQSDQDGTRETEANSSQQKEPTVISYKRRRTKEIICRGKRPSDIDSNGSEQDGNLESKEVTQEDESRPKRRKTGGNEGRRNRASPARLFKVNKELVQDQQDAVIRIEFGGLLQIATCSMPGDLSQWVMKHYDPEISQLIIPERGKIPVDAASVHMIWGLPNRGRKVCYEKRADYTSKMYTIFNINTKGSPTQTAWCKMIKEMDGAADDNFLRAWLAVAFSCLLAPTTSLNISPRCFPAVMHVDAITETNVCQFVVGQLKLAFAGAGDKNAVCCCVMHLVLLYLDSLDVDEPIASTVPRVSVWNSDLIFKVIKKDKMGRGKFGKLRLKTEFARFADESLFGSLDHVTKFVAARLPNSYDSNKQKKLVGMVHEICSEISHSVGKLVQGIGKLDDDGSTTNAPAADNVAGPSSEHSRKRRNAVVNDPDTLPSDEDSYQSGSDTDDGHDDDSEGSDGSEGDSDSDGDDGDGDRNVQTNSGGDDTQDQEDEQQEAVREEEEEEGEDADTEDEEEDKDVDEEHEEADDDNENEEDKEGDADNDGAGGNGDSGDQSNNRGHSSATNEQGAKNGSHEAVDNDSETDEGGSMEFVIEKRQNTQEIKSPEPFSLLDLVNLDVRKEGTTHDIPLLEVAYVSDGLSAAWKTKRIFKQLIDSLEFKKTFAFRLEDICPRKTCIELMRQVCGLNDIATTAVPVQQDAAPAPKGRPPKPPKKQRKVTFIDQPTVVTCDVLDELGAECMRRNEARRQSMQTPGTSQGGITHKATAAENKTTTLQMQATMTSSETTPSSEHSSKLTTSRDDQLAHSKNSGADARKLSIDSKESYVKHLQATISEDWAIQNKSGASHCHVQASLPGKTDKPLLTTKVVPKKTHDGVLPVSASQSNNDARGGHIQPNITVKQPASAPLKFLRETPSTKQHVAMAQKRQTLGDLNGRGYQSQHVIENNEKSIPRATTNKENQPPELFMEESSDAAKIDDICAKCIAPSSKLDQVQLGGITGMGATKYGCQQTEIPLTVPVEYCPAPTFSLGLEAIFGTSIVQEGQRPAGIFDDCCKQNGYEVGPVDIVGTRTDEGVLEVELSREINSASRGIVHMCPEAKGKTPMVIEIPDEGELEVELSQNTNGARRNSAHMFPEAKGTTPTVIEVPDDDLFWDLAEIDLACEEAEKLAQDRTTHFSMQMGNLSPTNFQTPEKTCCKDGEFGSSSSSGEITNKFERRIIKPPPCKRSPFVDYNENRLSHCTPGVNRLYAAVILHARLDQEKNGLEDKSPTIVDYQGYHVSLRELADSMKKNGHVKSHVFELIVETIMRDLPATSKKIIMPVRFSIRLQQMDWNTQEIRARFNKSKHLDRKDMIMFPILENLDSTDLVSANHYWLFNVNIRDRRFEVFDSWRTLAESKIFDDNVRLITASVRSLWDQHYRESRVSLDDFSLKEIDVPKQDIMIAAFSLRQ